MFENAPEAERKSDPERKGIAIIIDLDRIDGVLSFGSGGPVFADLAR